MSDASPVASSATPELSPAPALSAVEQAARSGDVYAFRAAKEAERQGKPLETKPADQPAETAPAKPVEQAGERPDNPPASESGKPSGHKGNAETRAAELRAEIDGLLRQRAELKREVRPPALQPTKPAVAAAAPGDDPEPKLEDFENDPDPYTAHLRALAKWEGRNEARRLDAEREARAEAANQVKTIEERDSQWRSRLKAETATDPTWLDTISDDVKALVPVVFRDPETKQVIRVPEPNGYNVIGQEIVLSERPAALMRYFSEHPEEFHALAGKPTRLIVWQMGKLEAKLEAPPAPPPAKTVTTAPPPPPTLGARPNESPDEVLAAVSSKDMAAFKAAGLRRRVANLR